MGNLLYISLVKYLVSSIEKVNLLDELVLNKARSGLAYILLYSHLILLTIHSLFQAYLLLVAKLSVVVTLSRGAIGRVKEEEGVATRFAVGLLVITAKDNNVSLR